MRSVVRVWRSCDERERGAVVKPLLVGSACAVMCGVLDVALKMSVDSGRISWSDTGGLLLLALLGLFIACVAVTLVYASRMRPAVSNWMLRCGLSPQTRAFGRSTLKTMVPLSLSFLALMPFFLVRMVIDLFDRSFDVRLYICPVLILIQVLVTLRCLAAELGKREGRTS
ncbi:hypothetical protein B5F74_00080 [Collinsella sp. An271]|uniref:hypothetical protein n=1 Tax=Collinsella sp. An271 TaxID=1965616 RepID=UPI000B3AF49F|nr:hypothetical protein [Collinsella sp. An271]OUO62326.1 hypothetical protein B5F74_00080 [Collinsella sp. An271]